MKFFNDEIQETSFSTIRSRSKKQMSSWDPTNRCKKPVKPAFNAEFSTNLSFRYLQLKTFFEKTIMKVFPPGLFLALIFCISVMSVCQDEVNAANTIIKEQRGIILLKKFVNNLSFRKHYEFFDTKQWENNIMKIFFQITLRKWWNKPIKIMHHKNSIILY